jgi:hypothetical protein
MGSFSKRSMNPGEWAVGAQTGASYRPCPELSAGRGLAVAHFRSTGEADGKAL